ncbi:MAG: zf-HC2 domain-containing protein [Acidobacteriia bacterium]|nr:zf-HC2 domain-containing protein [Terriglobia bacterium]
MNCQDFKKQTMDLVLGELSDESRPALEQHAAQCTACGAQLNRLVAVANVMRRGWRDEEVPTSLVFTPAVSPSASRFWNWLSAAPKWVNVSMATASALVVLFAALSLARANFRFDHGQFALSFGQTQGSSPLATSPSIPVVNTSMNSAEIENLITARYSSLNAQDRQQYAAMLDHLSQQMQSQREADLQRIGLAFDQVKTVVWKEMQRNNAIVQYAAQRIATNSKN